MPRLSLLRSLQQYLLPIAFAVLVLLASATAASGGVNVWTVSGPAGGFLEVVTVDGANPDVLYAGTLHGDLYKSVDGGSSWTLLRHVEGPVRVASVDPTNSDVLYTGGMDGLAKSTDGGLVFVDAASGLGGAEVFDLTIDPANPNTVYVATPSGVFKSTDAGVSWAAASNGLTDLDVRGITLDPTNPNILYTATAGGVFKSALAGAAWTAVNTGLAGLDVRDVEVDPLNPNTLYAGTTNGVFKSANAGATWNAASNGLTITLIEDLAVDPANPNFLYAATAGGGAFKSTDAAVSWNELGDPLDELVVRSLAIDPTNSNRLFAGAFGGGGFFVSGDGGATWMVSHDGLLATVIEALAARDGGTLYAGAVDEGLFASVDGGITWNELPGAVNDADVRAVAVDPANPNTLYAGTSGNGVLKSTDAGASWFGVSNGLTNLSVRSVTVDAVNPNILYATTAGGVFKSTDAGSVWSPSSTGLANTDDRDLLIDPVNPNTLYVATAGGIFKSTNAGGSWFDASSGLGSDDVRDLAIDPSNPNFLYAATPAGVFGTLDGGGEWLDLTDNLPAVPVEAILLDPTDPLVLYAGTVGGGVFVRPSASAGWRSLDNGLEHETILSLLNDPLDPARIHAGTQGGGVYSLTRRTVTLGDRVWLDGDGDGVQDEGEAGLEGIGVFLLDAVSGDEIAFAFTDPAGLYRFVELVPGEYVAEFVAPEMSGLIPTLEDRGGDDGLDSDIDPTTRRTDPFTLESGDENLDVDAGFILPVLALGDRVWRDLDADGLQDPDEPGFEGVTIRLLDGAGDDIASTVTDPDGTYLFLDLFPGEYRLEFVAPGGFLWSPRDVGVGDIDADEVDSDVDPVTGRTALLNLLSGDEDQTVDAGLFPAAAVRGIVWIEEEPDGIRRIGESGLPGIIVRLETPGGELLAQTETADNGRYAFTGLRPGEVVVRFVLITPFRFSPQDQGTNNTRDSDADPATGRTPILTLRPGTNLTSVDAGMIFEGDPEPPVPPTVLELQGGRFEVEVEWTDFDGNEGMGRVAFLEGPTDEPLPLRSGDSSVLEFFSPRNWEMLIKVLDGRSLNDHFWVFLAAATDVEYVTTVTDTSCDQVKTYVNPLGTAAPAVTDTTAFPGCETPRPPDCVVDEDTLCLGLDGRFQVEVVWRDGSGLEGRGDQVIVPESGLARSNDSGLFFFFDEGNWELLVKVLDGCSLNDHFWVFSAATTNVEYRLRVTDTLTDTTRTYLNPLGQAADALTDISAFATCDGM